MPHCLPVKGKITARRPGGVRCSPQGQDSDVVSPLDIVNGVWGALRLLVQANEDLGQGVDDTALLQVLAELLLLRLRCLQNVCVCPNGDIQQRGVQMAVYNNQVIL